MCLATETGAQFWAIDLQRFEGAGTVRGPLVDGQTVSGGITDLLS
jgi:hypothetical protein